MDQCMSRVHISTYYYVPGMFHAEKNSKMIGQITVQKAFKSQQKIVK
jgi:hypothetical protein